MKVNACDASIVIKVIAAAVFLTFASGCTTAKVVNQRVGNPMPELWAGVRTKIDSLEASRATFPEWAKVADSFEKITSITKLRATLAKVSPDAEERRKAEQSFQTAACAGNFGLECNIHALVFFDSAGRTVRTIKWE